MIEYLHGKILAVSQPLVAGPRGVWLEEGGRGREGNTPALACVLCQSDNYICAYHEFL